MRAPPGAHLNAVTAHQHTQASRARKTGAENDFPAPVCLFENLAQAYFLVAFFSASPRMSPSDAPESELPYCATACFSSAI